MGAFLMLKISLPEPLNDSSFPVGGQFLHYLAGFFFFLPKMYKNSKRGRCQK